MNKAEGFVFQLGLVWCGLDFSEEEGGSEEVKKMLWNEGSAGRLNRRV